MVRLDLLKDLHGVPLSCDALSRLIITDENGRKECTLLSFDPIPASEVVGKHSYVIKLRLEWQDYPNSMIQLPRVVVFKRMVPEDLEARSAEKWRRDVQSYKSEVVFYKSIRQSIAKQLDILHDERSDHAAFPLAYAAEIVESASPIECKFLLVLEDLGASELEQHSLLDESLMGQCVSYLAQFHAATFQNMDLLQLAHDRMWRNGCYWTLEKRATGEHEKLQSEWEKFYHSFKDLSPELFGRDNIARLGERLSAKVHTLNDLVVHKGLSSSRHLSLLHGDFKTANIFFTKSSSPSVSAIDFQWSGPGLGVCDLAYLIWSSGTEDVLSAENRWVELYWKELRSTASRISGLPEDDWGYSLEQLRQDYDNALLDYCRVVIVYMWGSVTPEICESTASKLGRCAHNRSINHALHLVKKIDSLLAAMEG